MKKIIPIVMSISPLLFVGVLSLAYFVGISIVPGVSKITAVPNFKHMYIIVIVFFIFLVISFLGGIGLLIFDIINKTKRFKVLYVLIFIISCIICRMIMGRLEDKLGIDLYVWLWG